MGTIGWRRRVCLLLAWALVLGVTTTAAAAAAWVPPLVPRSRQQQHGRRHTIAMSTAQGELLGASGSLPSPFIYNWAWMS
jgi:hypothetical protein